ncbi:unnamed protein product [Phytophthora fragariaefolia]|uniref:Unnamed protein product n=1 Tax=Phytophthora fragariaefolia TaxID=1490495 RepID=A0A9W6YPX8_9STRA|nr:unnamed protein product [Phytophthora fragariaefolia]
MVASRFAASTALMLLALGDTNNVAGTSSLPSLKLGFNVHRSTMEVFGTSTFDVFVKPVQIESSISFDGKVSFEQDGTTYNFVFIDSVPYYEEISSSSNSTTCLPTDNIPSIPDIVEALASATAVSSVNTDQGIYCINGTWLSTSFAGESYVLCANADSSDFMVYGEDLSISFEYLSEEVAITKPANAPSNCEAVTGDSVAMSSLGQIYGLTTSGSRRVLKEEAGAAHLASSKCACQGTPRPCLFFHGMDVEADGGIVDEYSFFGAIKEHAPCCSSFHFAILNTVDYAWYNETLQQKACNAAMNVTTGRTDSGLTEINDLIIVAHSMGNSMLAGALAAGKCSIGKNVDWVALSGPMKGSMGSDFIYQICGGSSSDSDTLLAKFGGLIGQCPGTTTRRSLVYDGGKYCDGACSLRYAAARAMHAKYVTAGICGTTYNGLISKEYAGLLAGGLLIPHHSSKNDGIVSFL